MTPIRFYMAGIQNTQQPKRNFSFPVFAELLKHQDVTGLADVRGHSKTNSFDGNPWCVRNLGVGLVACIKHAVLKSVAPSRGLPLNRSMASQSVETRGSPQDQSQCVQGGKVDVWVLTSASPVGPGAAAGRFVF